MIKILYISRDIGGCGFYRCQQPAEFIKRMGLADTETVLREPTQQQLLSADLVVMQEMGSQNAAQIAQFLLQNKIPYMVEFDDFVHHVSPHNVWGYPAWNPSTLFVHRAMELARSSFGIIVSTPQLAREYFPYNPAVYVVPNYLNKDKWSNPVVKHEDGKVRIGWAGGNAHADDLKMISNVLDKIVKENKGKIIFETMGMTKKELANVFPMRTFDETCPACGYEGEMHYYPGESLDDYPIVLASKGWDIALASVINNSFGNAKSDIKIKEYSSVGMPVIASPVVPYREAGKDGAEILFAESFEEWYNSIKELINDPERRNKIIKNNKEWVSRYWIQDNAQKIFEIFVQVLAKAEIVLGPKNNKKINS